MTGVAASRRTIARDPVAAAADPTDFTPTPAPVARAMVQLESWSPRVWEPSCGDGAISSEFVACGHDVVETDLVPRRVGSRLDFLQARTLLADDICTNPPFNIAARYADHALFLRPRKLMLLLPLGFQQAVSEPHRSLVATGRGLARVWVSVRRIPFKRGGWDGGKGGGPVHKHALFVWERGHAGPPALMNFDWKDFS